MYPYKEISDIITQRGSRNSSTPNLSRSGYAYYKPEPVPSLPLSGRQRGLGPPQTTNTTHSASTTNLEADFERMIVQNPRSRPANPPQHHAPAPFNFQPQSYMSPYAGQAQGSAYHQRYQAANASRGQFIGPPGRHAPTMSAFNDRRSSQAQVPVQPIVPHRPTQAGVIVPPTPTPIASSHHSFSSGHSSQSSVYPNSSSSGHSVHHQAHPGGPYASSSIGGHSNQSLAAGAPLYYPTNITGAQQYVHGGHGHSSSSMGAGSSHWQGAIGGLVPTAHNNPPTAMPHQAEQNSSDDMYMPDE